MPAPADVLRLRTLLSARLTRDGATAVCAVAGVSPDGRRDLVQLLAVDVGGDEWAAPVALTRLEATDTAPAWLPDGSGVVFLSDRAGERQLHRVGRDGAPPVALTGRPWGVCGVEPAVSPDGRTVVVGARAVPPRDRSEPYRVTDEMWRLEGVGLVRDAVAELFAVDADGGEPVQLTDHGAVPVSVAWSPDGGELLHLSFTLGERPCFQLRALRLADRAERLLWETPFEGFAPVAAWRGAGEIVRTGPNRALAHAEPLDLLVTAAAPDAPERVRTPAADGWLFGLLLGDFAWEHLQTPRIAVADDGGEAFVSVQVGGQLQAWGVALDGPRRARRLLAGDHSAVPLDAAAGRVALGVTSLHEPPDLWVAEPSGAVRRLTRLNGGDYPRGAPFDVLPLPLSGADGTALDAWFLRPHGADGPVPTLLAAHGGPHAGWGQMFGFDTCMLTAAGYGVLLVNHRGSTGYGVDFARDLHGDWGNLDASDLLRAVDAAVAARLAEPTALGVWGISGGGYLAAWLATHDDRFGAAVVESAVLDWTINAGADIGRVFASWLTRAGEAAPPTPAQRAAQSPASFAANCRTPTLIVHHEQDLRTPPANADSFYGLLKLHGCPAEMLRMPQTSHGGSMGLGHPRARVVQNEALLDWFDRHVRPRRPDV